MNPSDATPVLKWNTDRLRGPAWFRAVLATVACAGAAAAFIDGAVLNSHGCMDRLGGFIMICVYGVPLLIIGLPSIIIAIRLFKKTVLGIKVALTFDVIVVLMVMGITARWINAFYDPMNPIGEQMAFGVAPAVIALPFCVEGAWLLSACRGWRRAWWGFGMVLLVLLVGPWATHILRTR